jgi:hypothetical protein
MTWQRKRSRPLNLKTTLLCLASALFSYAAAALPIAAQLFLRLSHFLRRIAPSRPHSLFPSRVAFSPDCNLTSLPSQRRNPLFPRRSATHLWVARLSLRSPAAQLPAR